MSFKYKVISVFLIFMLSACSRTTDFEIEYSNITVAINCENPKITPKGKYTGALYSCIGGNAETVKVFVNESGGSVKNIKFMWNDWTKDLGDGIHADKILAESWLSKISSLYAEGLERQVKSIFFSDVSQKLETPNYVLEYRYTKGPAIDERLYIVTAKEVIKEKEEVIEKSASSYEFCKQFISKTVNYSTDNISGDGDPVNENGYNSFFFSGKNKDQFFCEVHSNGLVKIKAARGGKYPFKYIEQGHYEIKGGKLLSEMDDGDIQTAIKKLVKDVENGKVLLVLDLPLEGNNQEASIDKRALHLNYKGISYSFINPAKFDENTKTEFLKKFHEYPDLTLEEFNLAIDARTLALAFHVATKVGSAVFINPKKLDAGTIGVEVYYINKHTEEMAWEKYIVKDIAPSKPGEKISFSKMITNSITTLLK
jgi:hypothetical protein